MVTTPTRWALAAIVMMIVAFLAWTALMVTATDSALTTSMVMMSLGARVTILSRITSSLSGLARRWLDNNGVLLLWLLDDGVFLLRLFMSRLLSAPVVATLGASCVLLRVLLVLCLALSCLWLRLRLGGLGLV